ncbi:MAG: flagellar basal body P-ring formation chaperone FlgA [Syntrophales bacterium]
MKSRIYVKRLIPAVLPLMAICLCSICFGATARVITDSDIKAIVQGYIEKNMPWPKESVRVEFLSSPGDLEVSGSRVSWSVEGRHNENFAGNSVFRVKFYDRGTFVKEAAVKTRIEVLTDVLVSTRALSRDTEISGDDIKVVKKWLAQIPDRTISDPEYVVGKTLSTDIRPNTEITKGMLKNLVLVRKGKPVRILLESGPMVITTIGLTEDDGGRGDIIRVRNISSNKTIYARVLDQTSVRVDF